MAKHLSLKELLSLKKRMSATPSSSTGKAFQGDDDLIGGATVLERIEKLAFSNEMCLPIEKDVRKSLTPPRSIAICLVIVDKLYHEEIWKRWIADSSEQYQAELFIHAKHPESIQSEWVKARTLSETFRPEWNSVEVVRAMLAVLEKALDDTRHFERFVFGTESCVPLYGLQSIGEQLFEHDVSWLDAYHEPQHQFEEGVFKAVNQAVIPNKLVWKAIPGWVMVSRRHASELLHVPQRVGATFSAVRAREDASQVDLVDAFREVYAPEEIFFPTLMSICGFLTPTRISSSATAPGVQILKRRVTFARWRVYGDPNPIAHESLTPELLNEMRSSGSLFGRKFKDGAISADRWADLVLNVPPRVLAVSDTALETQTSASAVELDVNTKKRKYRAEDSAEDTITEATTFNGSDPTAK